jgi:hypothetical protein
LPSRIFLSAKIFDAAFCQFRHAAVRLKNGAKPKYKVDFFPSEILPPSFVQGDQMRLVKISPKST